MTIEIPYVMLKGRPYSLVYMPLEMYATERYKEIQVVQK